MDTKLKKMTANIKGIKGWYVLTVLGLDVLLGIGGGNLISTFYGDVIIYIAFLVTVTAGIILTISLRPDSKEWLFFGIFYSLFYTNIPLLKSPKLMLLP